MDVTLLILSFSRRRQYLWLELFECRYAPSLCHLGHGRWIPDFLRSGHVYFLAPKLVSFCWLSYDSCTIHTHSTLIHTHIHTHTHTHTHTLCEGTMPVSDHLTPVRPRHGHMLVEMFLRTMGGMNVCFIITAVGNQSDCICKICYVWMTYMCSYVLVII